jgi:8-oxo-dGTP diphosphatase
MPNIAADQAIHVVAGLIRHPHDASKIFISRRKSGAHLEQLWEFPGGKVKPGEARFHALKRELEEETGIRVLAALPFMSLFHRYKEKKIFLDVWEVISFSGEAEGLEGQEVSWVSQHHLDDYTFPEADIPVLNALSLPRELLITPDMPEQHEDSFVRQFEQLTTRRVYPLVQFRSHHLDDKTYAGVAARLNEICSVNGQKLIISRPTIKRLRSTLFDDYEWRHLNSSILQGLSSKPFDRAVKMSASCHDKQELKMAERLGCDFALLSTVRDTTSHPGRKIKGWYQIKKLIQPCRLPVYALGGVRRRDFSSSRFQGAIGVAGISDFWSS